MRKQAFYIINLTYYMYRLEEAIETFYMINLIYYRLEEAIERYRNRESRPEDLELIEQLRDNILEKEGLVKQLVVSFIF